MEEPSFERLPSKIPCATTMTMYTTPTLKLRKKKNKDFVFPLQLELVICYQYESAYFRAIAASLVSPVSTGPSFSLTRGLPGIVN